MQSIKFSFTPALVMLMVVFLAVLALAAQKVAQFVSTGLAQSKNIRVISENVCSADSSAHFTGCSSIL